ncbi:hypothetical protein OAU50_00855 [Planctomycetota bacterium]|nr:hypothetical protein [Planctomycetota bacterium]
MSKVDEHQGLSYQPLPDMSKEEILTGLKDPGDNLALYLYFAGQVDDWKWAQDLLIEYIVYPEWFYADAALNALDRMNMSVDVDNLQIIETCKTAILKNPDFESSLNEHIENFYGRHYKGYVKSDWRVSRQEFEDQIKESTDELTCKLLFAASNSDEQEWATDTLLGSVTLNNELISSAAVNAISNLLDNQFEEHEKIPNRDAIREQLTALQTKCPRHKNYLKLMADKVMWED